MERMNVNLNHQLLRPEPMIAFGTIHQIMDRIAVLNGLEQVTHKGKDEYEPDPLTPVS